MSLVVLPILLLTSGCSASPLRMAAARVLYSSEQVEECDRLRDALLTGIEGDVVAAFERAVEEVAPGRIVEVSVTEWSVGSSTGRGVYGLRRAKNVCGGPGTSWDGTTEVGDGETHSTLGEGEPPGAWEPTLSVFGADTARAIAEGPLQRIAVVDGDAVELTPVPDGTEVFYYEHRTEAVGGRYYTVLIGLREDDPVEERPAPVRP